jgi:hypothetical protein
MTKTRIDNLKSVLRLVRFLAWYSVIVAAAIYLLPWVGQWIQGVYDSMSIGTRAFSVLGILAVAAAGQLVSLRGRSKPWRGGRGSSQSNTL